jgi:hypothetical protein
VRVYFVGEPTWTQPLVDRLIHEAFDPVPGEHEISLTFHPGQGYRVLAASKEEPHAGPLARTDIRSAVAGLLREKRIAVEE